MRLRVVLVALLLMAPLAPSISATPPKAGALCSKAGIAKNYNGKKYTCIKSGKKLVWNKGVVLKPTPTPTSNPTTSPTPNPTTSPTPTPIPTDPVTPVTPTNTNNNQNSQTSFKCEATNVSNLAASKVSTTISGVNFTAISPQLLELEDAVRLQVSVINDSNSAKTIKVTNTDFAWATPPKDTSQVWYTVFFQIDPSTKVLQPGQSTTFTWHLDPIDDTILGRLQPIFKPTFDVGGLTSTLSIELNYFWKTGSNLSSLGIVGDAQIEGILTTSDGKPVSDVEVEAHLFNFKLRYEFARTDFQGKFTICVGSQKSLLSALGGRNSAYALNTYLLAKTKYGFAYTAVSPPDKGTYQIKLVLKTADPKKLSTNYEQLVNSNHGWWRLKATDDGFVAEEGRHPPSLSLPGQVAIFSNSGTIKTKMATASECWGLDISTSGNVAAGCHDGTLQVWNSNGSSLWKQVQKPGKQNVLVRWVRFSNDGSKLISGPFDDAVELRAAQTGQLLWGYTPKPLDGRPQPLLLRNAVFSADGKTVFISLDNGWLASLDVNSGRVNWEGWYLGEFAMTMEVDSSNSIYVVGKSREILAVDSTGNEKWRTLMYEASTISSDNSLLGDLFIGNSMRSVYAININSGQLVWWYPVQILYTQRNHTGSGHNALDVDPVRGLILHGAGTMGGGASIAVLNRDGVLLASAHFEDAREKKGETLNVNHIGATSVIFGKDGKIYVGFGDGWIRILELN